LQGPRATGLGSKHAALVTKSRTVTPKSFMTIGLGFAADAGPDSRRGQVPLSQDQDQTPALVAASTSMYSHPLANLTQKG